MKILLTSIGTRGDMEPFLAIGELLKARGHHIICLFPEQFRELAEDSGFEFASLGTEFIKMLDSEAGRIAMGGGRFGWKKMKAYQKLISMQKGINKEMIRKQEAVILKEKPDRIVHNGKTIYPVIWGIENKDKRILVSPVPYLHYVKGHTHVAFNSNYGEFLNKLTYKIANFGLVKTISSSVKWLSEKVDISTKDISRALFENKVMYTVSPSLFPRPKEWPDNFQVLGYHERKKTSNWNPSEELISFIKNHEKVVLLTFGSMINLQPEKNTHILMEVLEKNKIPTIINVASGGLVKPESYNEELYYFVEQIPYDWVFPQLYAVIHHGGSGTTHTAIKYGCASMLIPHIIDQYVWNKMIHEKQLGPLGIDVSKLTTNELDTKLRDLYTNLLYKQNAEKLGQQMQAERFEDEICEMIVNQL